MKSVDYNFSDLCDEIDYWKEQAQYWEKKHNDLQSETLQRLRQDGENARKGIGQMLSLALSIEDNEDGSISISKENREGLAKMFEQ